MLAPLSAIYGRAVLARRRRFESRPASRLRLARPVVSVGNLAVGGSGKTPFTRWLAGYLVRTGERPSILSRGYRRRSPAAAVIVVSDGRDVLADLARAGDEPLMIARTVAGAVVLVCAERYRAGLMAEEHFSCTVHLLDDGFQHVRLERDVDLLMLDEQDVHDRVLPAGRLREPLEAARSADAVLWTGSAGAVDALTRLGVEETFRLRRTPGPVTALTGEERIAPGTPVAALAGIARPSRFFRELQDTGLEIRAELRYGDHHPYSPADVARIRQAVARAGAQWVVTTEKDLVRLLALGDVPLRLAWRRLDVVPEDPDAFCRWLDSRLQTARDMEPRTGAGATVV